MTPLVNIALLGWIPISIGIFAMCPPRRALLLCFVLGYMFLPNAAFQLPGLPDYDKPAAICYGALLGIFIFDVGRLMRFRFSLIDIPMVIWCLSPFISALTNDLGPYEGASAVVAHLLVWGLPYFLGRTYLTDAGAFKELSLLLIGAVIVYTPLCLLEVRLSPQLHRWIYGFHAGSFVHNIRYGGYRPTVFMATGLALAMFMASGTLCAWWLWSRGIFKRYWLAPAGGVVAWLTGVFILIKSSGAILLFGGALAALYSTRWLRTSLPLIVLLLAAPTYSTLRATQSWDGQEAVELAEVVLNPGRAQSLQFRLDNEDILIAKALQRPMWGWGRFGRARVYDENGKDISITDGLWVIVLGEQGLVGLAAMTTVFLLPGLVLVYRFGYRIASMPVVAPVAVWVVIVALYALDNQLNAMPNPVFLMGMGGLSALVALGLRPAPAAAKKTPPRQAAGLPQPASGPAASAQPV